MTWLQALVPMAIALVALFVPGFVVLRALGLRSSPSAATAPLVSCGLIGVAGILAGLLHVRWGVLPYLVLTALAVLAAWAARRFIPVYRPAERPRPAWGLVATFALVTVTSALTMFIRIRSFITSPQDFAQVYDDVFHLNAIRYILDTGNASTLTLGRLTAPGSSIAIYPSVWHSAAALVAQLSGATVAVAQNAVLVTTATVVWPVACMVLVWACVGRKPVAVAAAGILSTGMWVFPFEMMQFGPLYPNILSYSLLPLALAAVVTLCASRDTSLITRFQAIPLLVVGLAALALTQPNGVASLLACSIPLLVAAWARPLRLAIKARNTRRAVVVGLAGLVGAVLLFGVWHALLLAFDAWTPTRNAEQALADALTGSYLGADPMLLLAVLSLVGAIAVLLARRHRSLLAMWLVAVFLYVVSASRHQGTVRMFFTGGWYQDVHRLAALAAVMAIPLAAVGTQAAFDAITARLPASWRMRWALPTQASALEPVAALVVAVALLGATAAVQKQGFRTVERDLKISYALDNGAYLVSRDEYDLMRRLRSHVPADEVIAVNPWNGGALAYAIAGIRTTEFHLTPGPSKDVRTLEDALPTLTPGSPACVIAKRDKIGYVLDFGSRHILDFPQASAYPHLENVSASRTLELVDRQGSAKLFKIVGC